MKIEDMISARRSRCCGCEACANICPKNAITMTRDAEGFSYPKINPDLCIKCGRCDATCPALNYKKNSTAILPPTFVATYDNDKILRHSSSGGMFTALSELVLNDGGIVFGASFDKKWHVFHTAARTLDELENLRGSKYVQSQIGDVYRQVKDALKSKKVLFSGTPCQCAGLRNFLGGDHENLFTVDIICHGVPSPALWESYIGRFNHLHEVATVNFRSKRNGWGGTIDINFFDRVHIASSFQKNLYTKLFLSNLTLRSACSFCKFRFPSVQSDLTIGDAWGINDFAPEMNDKRGVSLVFIHTEKGKEFFERTNVKSKQVNFFDTLKKNKLLIAPTVADLRRRNFFAEFAKTDDKLAVMQKYFDQNDEDIRKQVAKEQRRAFSVAYNEIIEFVRQNFTQNALIIAPFNDNAKISLIKRFRQANPNGTLYFMWLNSNDELACKEGFSMLDLPIKAEVDALKEFAEKFHITKVMTTNSVVFYLPSVTEWLKICELPVKIMQR